MLSLHVIQAAYGDSLILEYRDQGSSRLLLIDGGPAITYAQHLKPAIDDIARGKGRLDLIVLTHIDNDHICGIMDCLKEMKNSRKQHLAPIVQVDGIWHNTFKQTIGVPSEIAPRVLELAQKAELKGLVPMPGDAIRGMDQGERTSELARDLGIPVNAGFRDGLVLCENAPAPWLVEGLGIWILGPNRQNLERLQRQWLAWLEKKMSEPVTRAVEEDTSVPNLSSIMLLAEADGRQILLTGDSTGKEILAGLESVGKLDESGKIHVDVLKVPHHGSSRNVTEAFFDNVTADLYVISANGRSGNPGLPTLEWIVTSAKRHNRAIRILATNETKSTRKLMQKYDQHTYGYTLIRMKPGQHYVTV